MTFFTATTGYRNDRKQRAGGRGTGWCGRHTAVFTATACREQDNRAEHAKTKT